jgi:carboxypeptidase C (cathepsin A)
MNKTSLLSLVILGWLSCAPADAQGSPAPAKHMGPDSVTEGAVNVSGHTIAYKAVAGTITVGATDAQDSVLGEESLVQSKPGAGQNSEADGIPIAAMFYVAYLEKDAKPESRPVTFIYNGGPGSASLWLHMGAFGPKRVVTADAAHTRPAPYPLVNNNYSLLDASDLVFIDAPGTGFGQLFGKDKEKAFWGADEDGNAFARFIDRFISQYNRWNSPKFLLGESYGTARSANLANILQLGHGIDLNGLIMVSQLLDYSNSAHVEVGYPGTNLPFILALPTYAATAYYYHRVDNPPATLEAFLKETGEFATTDYARALLLGSELSAADATAIAQKLHRYTGLPTDYLLKVNLRVTGGEFEEHLQADKGLTSGRLDTRFSGPTMDSLSDVAQYDPQIAAIGAAYAAAFNDYARNELKYGASLTYIRDVSDTPGFNWNPKHRTFGGPPVYFNALNVMPDLAWAMKYNPHLKLMLNCGYYDLSTPFFAALYDVHHLQIPAGLQNNVSYKFYQTGHMVFVSEPALKQLHDNVAEFIWSTVSGK